MSLSRHRVTCALLDGFTFREGETCDRRGESLVGARYFAVNVTWTELVTPFPNMRTTGEWVSRWWCDAFDIKRESARFAAYTREQAIDVSPEVAAEFRGLRRAFGSWRAPNLNLNLGVALLVPSVLAAVAWSRLFAQTHTYDLARKRTIDVCDICRFHSFAQQGVTR